MTFCFHKRTQGVRQSPILYSLKTERTVVFVGLFNMSLSTNFMYKWVTVPWKYSEKEETVSKRSIKYYYIESHSEWKTFLPNFQPSTREPEYLHKMAESLFTIQWSEGNHSCNWPFFSPPSRPCLLRWCDLGDAVKGTLVCFPLVVCVSVLSPIWLREAPACPRPDLCTWGEFITWDLLSTLDYRVFQESFPSLK